jgi:hypothetical protein
MIWCDIISKNKWFVQGLFKTQKKTQHISYLGVDSNDLAALVAVVGEHVLVALDAVGMVIPQYVAVARQGIVTMVAKHFLLEKFVDGLGFNTRKSN